MALVNKIRKKTNSLSWLIFDHALIKMYMVHLELELINHRLDCEKLLHSCWQIFHDSPARRDDFITITDNTVFPSTFCDAREVGSKKAADKALFIGKSKKYCRFFEETS